MAKDTEIDPQELAEDLNPKLCGKPKPKQSKLFLALEECDETFEFAQMIRAEFDRGYHQAIEDVVAKLRPEIEIDGAALVVNLFPELYRTDGGFDYWPIRDLNADQLDDPEEQMADTVEALRKKADVVEKAIPAVVKESEKRKKERRLEREKQKKDREDRLAASPPKIGYSRPPLVAKVVGK